MNISEMNSDDSNHLKDGAGEGSGFSFSFFDCDVVFSAQPSASPAPLHRAVVPAQVVPSEPVDFYVGGEEGVDECALVSIEGLVLKRTTRPPSRFPEGFKADHDVVSGKYEGGYKVWECSLDLVQYLGRVQCSLGAPQQVLELGCGQGFPGIAALQRFPSCRVVFSDLNAEVLQETTWRNIHLNAQDVSKVSPRVMCVAGDWSSLDTCAELIDPVTGQPLQFDLILSAETLYTAESTRALLAAISSRLAPNGCALLANKRYYFGLGGGTLELEQQIQNLPRSATDPTLSMAVVQSVEDGQSNIRDIISLTVARAACTVESITT